MTQKEFVLSYYKSRPNEEINHKVVVDWVVTEWERRNNTKFRDPDRAIRSLYEEGLLQKISKGVYKYDPDFVNNKSYEEFSSQQKKIILERDGYKCAICGLGKSNDIELHIDHIKAREHGGKAIIENGQVLCSRHNMLKKSSGQTETGKKMFINLLRSAKATDDKHVIDFCESILKVFDDFNMNGHIEWKK